MRGILRVALVVGAGFGLGFGNVTTSVAQGATAAHLASPFTEQPRPDGKAHVFRVDGGSSRWMASHSASSPARCTIRGFRGTTGGRA
jgi:hypothetical protein